jgi:hypothetical protein
MSARVGARLIEPGFRARWYYSPSIWRVLSWALYKAKLKQNQADLAVAHWR